MGQDVSVFKSLTPQDYTEPANENLNCPWSSKEGGLLCIFPIALLYSSDVTAVASET